MSEEITIYSYPHNGIPGSRPRKPMVHLLATEYGEVQSISFHPDYADRIAGAILKAARSAKSGRGRQPVTITLTSGQGKS